MEPSSWSRRMLLAMAERLLPRRWERGYVEEEGVELPHHEVPRGPQRLGMG